MVNLPLKITCLFIPAGGRSIQSLSMLFSTHCYLQITKQAARLQSAETLFPVNMLQLKDCNVNSCKEQPRST